MRYAVQGAPVYSNYGFKSNEELILGYGFMLEDNPADFFHVSLGLHAQTEHGEPYLLYEALPVAPLDQHLQAWTPRRPGAGDVS